MDADSDSLGRRLWAACETIHAVTYFHPTCLGAIEAAGAKGFWMGYFVARMAPLGAVTPAVAEAVAFGFAPLLPYRALPDGWTFVPPAVALEVRRTAAAAALRSYGLLEVSTSSLDALEALRTAANPGGHPLGAANRALVLSGDRVERLWQLVTWFREHRGDEHVARWAAEGFDGCESNVLTTAVHRQDSEILRRPRGWTAEEWSTAAHRLERVGLLKATPAGWEATDGGSALHYEIESETDWLTDRLLEVQLSTGDLPALVDDLEAVGSAIRASGLYPYPNPIGLPE